MVEGSNTFLSQEFLSKYEGLQPRNKGILFEVLHLRSYARYLPELKRRETWLETVERVTNYSVGLYQGPANQEGLIKEAELMFDKVFHLEVLPAGRTLWIGGTDAAKKQNERNFNCSGLVISKIDDFCDIFHLLLCGCGVGYRILKDDVSALPLMSTNFDILHKEYKPKHPSIREEDTIIDCGFESTSDWVKIEIGDSIEGWVKALRTFLHRLATNTGKYTVFFLDYNSIRPEGERIRTSGGIAPGPKGLEKMFTNIAKLIKDTGGCFTPVAAMDLANMISFNVIVGGTRRSAQIALGDPEDREFIEAKRNLYKQIDGNWIKDESREHRVMSNNSVVFTSKPSLEKIKEIFSNIKDNGEPGFFNLEAALSKRPKAGTANPCMEILLANYGVCNLSTVVLPSHIENGKLNVEKLHESVRLATRIGLRQTNVTLSLPHWDEVQKRDRLTGVSFTGFMDLVDRLEWDHDSNQTKTMLEGMGFVANDEADRYSFEMRVPRPLLVTAIKPEGSLSLLPTVSPGLHRSYAPHYIRRVRVSALDPVCKALKELGVPNEPDKTKKDSGRVVFSFPIKSGAKTKANDESALSQFNRYLNMQRYYTDHNSSCTLTVGDDEWESIAQSVYINWKDVVACAFLPKEEGTYPQMPLESITEEAYNKLMMSFPDLSKLPDIVNKYEKGLEFELEALGSSDCSANGSCPTR